MTFMRREFHRNPEPAYQEFHTAALAAQQLEILGYRVKTGIAGSGVIAEIGDGETIVIRAEMDAVEMQELNQVEYRSTRSGWMHACGHDAHVASVIGAAEILARVKTTGKIRIVLQPAEEAVDLNGHKGSHHMIAYGALEDAKAILGMHVDTTMRCGSVGVIARPLIDNQTSFVIRIADAENDAIEMSQKLLSVLLSQRKSVLWRSAELQIAEVHGSSHTNTATIRGCYASNDTNSDDLARALNQSVSEALKQNRMIELSSNDQLQTAHKRVLDLSYLAAGDVLGAHMTSRIQRKSWTREFAQYAKAAPASFFFIGCEVPGYRAIQHTPTFDIDERCLAVTAAVLAESALSILADK